VDCYKGKDRDKETIWIRVTLWGNMAESLAPHLTKGKMVSVSGDLEAPDAWIGKQDGEAHAALNITGRNLTFCGGGKEGENSGQRPAAARPQQAESSNGIMDEDIPF
jgi:single-stranded DNA-binding protein